MRPAEPARYTHGHAASVLASHRWRTAENSAGYLVAELPRDAAVLDVGCGPGTVSIGLARAADRGRVVGVDRAPEAVAAAVAAAAADGVANAAFAVGDVASLPFGDRRFDVVHAHQVLQHLADPVAALREMRRVCRPGGWVAARDADYAGMTWHPADPALDRWLELYRALARRNGGEPDAGRRLLAWTQAAGFGEARATASTWCFATPDDRAWWGSTWADRVTSTALAAQLVDAGLAEPRELAEIGAAWRRWAREPAGWFAVVHGEVLARA